MASIFSSQSGYYSLDLGTTGTPSEAFPYRPNLFAKYLALTAAILAGVIGFGYVTSNTPTATSLNTVPSTAQRVSSFQPAARLSNAPKGADLQQQAAASEDSKGKDLSALASVAAATSMVTLMGPVSEASAGTLLQGRTAALMHPASMFAMLALSLWAGWLGLQWKRARTIGQEITDAKAEVTALSGKLSKAKLQGSVKETLAALRAAGETISPGDLELLNNIAVAEQKVEDLQAERKALTAGNFRDRHFNAGAAILAVGVSSAVVGPVNTYIRTGKLFPGPHLYIGAAMVSMWAVAAALVPAMQKGNETARSIHVALNAVNTAFFLWQVVTGLEILGKVVQFTTWP